MKRFSTDPGRLEAFSDGVLAVIITIMVLELRPPHGTDFGSLLREVGPTFVVYAVSFVFIGIYWNNHHHMLRASHGIDGRVMWANLHLLFWLSLAPFTTAWLGQHVGAHVPTFAYTLDLLLDAIAYTILQATLLSVNGRDTAFAHAVRRDVKGYGSIVLYVVALIAAFFAPVISYASVIIVAIWWLVPDRRLEPVIQKQRERDGD